MHILHNMIMLFIHNSRTHAIAICIIALRRKQCSLCVFTDSGIRIYEARFLQHTTKKKIPRCVLCVCVYLLRIFSLNLIANFPFVLPPHAKLHDYMERIENKKKYIIKVQHWYGYDTKLLYAGWQSSKR